MIFFHLTERAREQERKIKRDGEDRLEKSESLRSPKDKNEPLTRICGIDDLRVW